MLARVKSALQSAKPHPLVSLPPRRTGLGGPEHGLKDRGGGAPEGVGGRQPRLVRHRRDKRGCLGVLKAPRVYAYGDHGRRLDEGRDLLVEAGDAGGDWAGNTGEDLLVWGGCAEDEAVRARAVEEAERDPGVSRMPQGTLAFDQDQLWVSSRRLQDELLRSAGDEVRDYGVHADAPPGDDDARLSRRDEPGPYARLARSPLYLQGRRHLAYGRIGPDGERHPRPHPEALSGEERHVIGRLAHVPDPLSGEQGSKALVQTADYLEPRVGRATQRLHPLLGQPPAGASPTRTEVGAKSRASSRERTMGASRSTSGMTSRTRLPASVESITATTSSLP